MNDKRTSRRAKHELAPERKSRNVLKSSDPAIDDDRRLDAELADSFPASDPPSILRRGPRISTPPVSRSGKFSRA
jgi:hypothetical protein